MEIRPARPDEAALLSDLAQRSKAAWGYESGMTDAFRDELTVDPATIPDWHIHVAADGADLAGFYALSVQGDGVTGEIELMFVEPCRMRRGIGRALWAHLIDTARSLGLTKILIDADPYAEPFYRAMGARRTGEAPSVSIPGRMLPRLEVDLG